MASPTDVSSILKAESELGVQLPEAFRARLLAENGGEVVVQELVWELNTTSDIASITAYARTWPDFPKSAVAIATFNSSDHLICFPSADGKRLQNAIYAWWHENGELEKVADSFEELNP